MGSRACGKPKMQGGSGGILLPLAGSVVITTGQARSSITPSTNHPYGSQAARSPRSTSHAPSSSTLVSAPFPWPGLCEQ